MSLLSAVGSAGSSLFGFLQKLTGQQQTNSTSLTSALQNSNNTSESDSSSGAASLLSPHHGMKKALMKKIESAVTTALQQATTTAASGTSATGSPANVNQIVQKAIEGVLNSTADGSPLEAEQENSSTNSTSGTSEGTHSAFMQLLSANGIDAKQFGADFQEAMQQVQGGGVNLSSILSTLEPGSLIDEIA